VQEGQDPSRDAEDDVGANGRQAEVKRDCQLTAAPKGISFASCTDPYGTCNPCSQPENGDGQVGDGVTGWSETLLTCAHGVCAELMSLSLNGQRAGDEPHYC
jgi:hypothetical protein